MDVELPDGTVIEGVPEGTTKAQLISKLKAGGYDVAPLTESILKTKEMPTTGEQALSNLLDVGVLMGGGAALAGRQYAKPVMEGKPFEPLVEAGKAAVGLPIMAGQAALGDVAAQQQLRGLPANVIQDYMQAYGSPAQAYRTAVTQPGRFATDVMLAPSLAKGIATAAPNMPTSMILRGANRLAEPILGPIFRPEQTAANKLMQSLAGSPEEAAAALRAPLPVTPGAPQATAAQRLTAAGMTEPGIAGLEASYMDISTPEGMRIYQQEQTRVNAIQNQIARIDEDLKTRATEMSPDAVAQLRTVRDQLNQSLATEQAALTSQAQGIAARLPETGQRAPGQAIAGRVETLETELKKGKVRPVFKQAFREAGKSPIDTTRVIRRTEQILGRPLSEFAPETAPQTVRLLQNLPETATLKQLDEVRRAVGLDIASAEKSMAPGAAQTLPNLYGVYDAIKTAIANSPELPDSARRIYNKGLEIYREETVPRFKTGVVNDILRTTGKNEPRLIPDKIVGKFLENENNAQQFATTFGQDRVARQTMLKGVEDLARKAIVDPATGMVNPAEVDKFLAANGRQLNIMGVDAQSVLQPIKEEATRLQNGIKQLQDQAKATKKATVVEVVDTALKARPNMDFLMRRLDNNGLEALRKDVSDRALNAINRGDTKEALDYLTKNKRTIQMAIGEDAYKNIRDLADSQKLMEEITKSAPKPDKSIVVDIGNTFTKQELTDYRVLADEIKRLKEVENLSGVGPAEGMDVASKQAEQAGVSPKRIPPYLSAKVTTLKSGFDKILGYGNKRVAAVLIDALYNNPDRAAALIEDAIARKRTRPMLPAPESTAPARRERNVLAPIIGAVQVKNAMTRQEAR